MSNKAFTEEKIKVLSMNPYVKHVSDKGIAYTPGFKEEFMKRYAKGKLPTEIFRSLGFDTKVLGKCRIISCTSRFKQYNERINALRIMTGKAVPPFVKVCHKGGIRLFHGYEYSVVQSVFVKAAHGLKIAFVFVALEKLLYACFNTVGYLFNRSL